LPAGSGALLNLLLKFGFDWTALKQLLPLPKELAVYGWIATVFATALGIVLAYRMGRRRRFESAPPSLIPIMVLAVLGFAGMPILFLLVDAAWKITPDSFFGNLTESFLYHILLPVTYGTFFGLLGTAFTLLAFRLAEVRRSSKE
jgi:hypothetical protein